jgi:hypothetical protein
MGAQVLLHNDHGRQAGPRRGEDGEEAVALGGDLLPLVLVEACPDQTVMIGQDSGVGSVAQGPQERRRTFNVSEQENQGGRAQSLIGSRPRERQGLTALDRHCRHARHVGGRFFQCHRQCGRGAQAGP